MTTQLAEPTIRPEHPSRAPGEETAGTSRALPPRVIWLPDATRRTLAVFGASGCGKSVVLGKILAWQDFVHGRPVVISDPKGQTLAYFLCKIASRPAEERAALASRVRYIDLNGQDGRVVPFPVYAPTSPTDRFDTIADRFVNVAVLSDPHLKRASIQGKTRSLNTAVRSGSCFPHSAWASPRPEACCPSRPSGRMSCPWWRRRSRTRGRRWPRSGRSTSCARTIS